MMEASLSNSEEAAFSSLDGRSTLSSPMTMAVRFSRTNRAPSVEEEETEPLGSEGLSKEVSMDDEDGGAGVPSNGPEEASKRGSQLDISGTSSYMGAARKLSRSARSKLVRAVEEVAADEWSIEL